MKFLTDFNFENKKVVVRVDYNVPISQQKVTDETRILETIPTINHLIQNKAKIILIAHLGRPKGKKDPKYSLYPVVSVLEKYFNTKVYWGDDCISEESLKKANELKPTEILLLENLRFYDSEEKNEPEFAKRLAKFGDFFVQDAFGAVHRAHASTVGITKYLPSACGFLLKKEIDALSNLLQSPKKPFTACIGGAKISDKIATLENLLNFVDNILIGGAMAYTFLKSQNINVGSSLVEPEMFDTTKILIQKAIQKKVDLLLPQDHLISKKINEIWQEIKNTESAEIMDEFCGVDIGSKTIATYKSVIKDSKTIFWNGPMGIFEVDEFSKGTTEIARTISQATKEGATSVAGGGDSIAAIKKVGLERFFTHISTGGGASLEFLEGKKLPGIEALD